MIKAICMYAPIIFSVIIVILCLLYKLDKLHPQVIADLKKRDEQGICKRACTIGGTPRCLGRTRKRR